jgi:N-acyl-D-amino-acid deacylase
MATYDLILRNGTLIDGSGEPRRDADIAIKGDRIVAIGERGTLKGDNELDVSGKVVAPGFIDVHTHDDTALIENPGMAMKASQGVTTVVCGNCGFSAAPYSGPKPVPHNLSLIVKQEKYLTQSFAAFAELVEAARPAINGAFLIGHATLRYSVLGTDLDRPASESETTRMRDMLDNALADGAIGMSSGLFYPPAAAATTDEVAGVAEPLGRHGAVYTAHMRDESDDILAAMDETFAIGRRAGAPVVVSHHKCSSRQNFGRMRETLPKFDQAMKDWPIAFDVYPYVAGSTILHRGMLDRAEKVMVTWSQAMPSAGGRDLKDIAAELGCSIHEAADRLQPAGAIYWLMSEDDVQKALSHPQAMIGSDGLPLDQHPHPRLWGTFPRVLGHYSRELGLFPLEEAVRRMTSLSAKTFGLAKRGLVREGHYADICVFDPATVIDTATFEQPVKPAQGIVLTLCNGVVAWQGGHPALGGGGRVLRLQEMKKEAS